MREALRNLLGAIIPDHVGLAYERYAPSDEHGRIPDDRRRAWLEELERTPLPHGYPAAFERWRRALDDGHTRWAQVKLAGRLFIGHGNLSATEVGLTLHHTWGVPLLPGSALKGLTAHHVDAVYGPDARGPHPFDPVLTGEAAERARFQGITWRDGRPEHGPGDVYRALFGAPPANDDLEFDGAGPTRGDVIFHDAWYVPESVTASLPLAQDVITVHQKSYYDAAGRGRSPNDYDRPVPISFLTVKPGASFLLAVSDPRERADLTELALHLLHAALEDWGIGGKTSSGYGRMTSAGARTGVLAELARWLDDPTPSPGTAQPLSQRERLQRIRDEWLARLVVLPGTERNQAAKLIRRAIRSPRLERDREALLRELLDER